jgi:hypothetical protein
LQSLCLDIELVKTGERGPRKTTPTETMTAAAD